MYGTLVSHLMSAAVAAATPPGTPCGLIDSAPHDCYARLEAETLARHLPGVTRSGEELRIVARNGKATILVSTPDDETYSGHHDYKAIGFLETGRFVVVHDGRWEGRNVLLVSLNDGAVTSVDGMPIVSPDPTRIAIHSKDLCADYDHNLLAVYRVDGSTLVREILLSGDSGADGGWGPDQVVWQSPTRISYLRSKICLELHSTEREAWELVLDHGSWTTRPPSSSVPSSQ